MGCEWNKTCTFYERILLNQNIRKLRIKFNGNWKCNGKWGWKIKGNSVLIPSISCG
jgi:hypothetical protein